VVVEVKNTSLIGHIYGHNSSLRILSLTWKGYALAL